MDERDFKEVSSVGKGKSKKNRAVAFVLTAVSAESASEDDEVEGDCSSTSEIERSAWWKQRWKYWRR